MRAFTILASVGLVAAASGANAAILFDNMSAFESTTPGATVSATSSTPNTFMGDAYGLVTGATSITGFDVYPANLSGTAFDHLKITIYVWDNVNMGTVNATTPAFSNLLSTVTLTTAAGSFPTGNFFPFEGTPNGTNPGILLGTPIAITDNIIGVTFNYQGSTDGGVTYNSINSLTSLISLGLAPTVGSNVLGGATGGYYRNAGTPSETNGNFTSAYRSITGTNENLALRVYGDVPAPGSAALLGLGGLVAARRRRAR